MEVLLMVCVPFAIVLIAVILRVVALAMPETAIGGWRRTLLSWISLFLMVIALFGMVFLIFAVGFPGVIGLFFSGLLVVLFVEAELRLAGVRNRARQAEMLWVLAIAVKSGRPLADEIEAYAEGSYGRRHRLLMEMADRLREGASLTEIVVPQGLLPSSAGMQIHAGITSKSLNDSLSRSAVRVTQDLGEDREMEFPGAGLAYPAVILTTASIVVGFLIYYIIPKFLKIFDDFNTELPDITKLLINISTMIGRYWFALGLPVLVYVPIVICIIAGFSEYFGWKATLQSFLGRWFVRWHTPDVLRALSQSFAQNIPVKDALIPLVKYAGPLKLRYRLTRAMEAIDDGADCWQALQAAGLLKYHETVVLEVAQRTGNVPWALDSLARSIERRRLYWIRAVLEFVQPLWLLCIGMVIGFIALAIFMPLVKLLNDFS